MCEVPVKSCRTKSWSTQLWTPAWELQWFCSPSSASTTHSDWWAGCHSQPPTHGRVLTAITRQAQTKCHPLTLNDWLSHSRVVGPQSGRERERLPPAPATTFNRQSGAAFVAHCTLLGCVLNKCSVSRGEQLCHCQALTFKAYICLAQSISTTTAPINKGCSQTNYIFFGHNILSSAFPGANLKLRPFVGWHFKL